MSLTYYVTFLLTPNLVMISLLQSAFLVISYPAYRELHVFLGRSPELLLGFAPTLPPHSNSFSRFPLIMQFLRIIVRPIY